MKPANATFGGTPNSPPTHLRRNDRRHSPEPRPPLESGPVERSRWTRCEEDAPADTGHPPTTVPEEPSTGVVYRVEDDSSRDSGLIERAAPHPNSSDKVRAVRRRASGDGADGWRCLSWDRAQKERRVTSHSKVTIVQLSRSGDLVRQNGPDAWLPDAGDFVHRMARLLAQGFGFARCRSLCLRGQSTVLTVSEAGETRLVAVSGPLRSMTNVLRRAGLE
jgi:hypothetical protein